MTTKRTIPIARILQIILLLVAIAAISAACKPETQDCLICPECAACPEPAAAIQVPLPTADMNMVNTTHFTNIRVEDLDVTDDLTVADDATITDDLTVTDDLTISGDIAVAGDLTIGDGTPSGNALGGLEDLYVEGGVEIDGILDVDSAIYQDITLENIGNLPTIDNAAVITSSNAAIWTVGAAEIWFVWAVYCDITTNFDCTGDDCTLIIGDGNDTDGFLVLADGEMQAADAEYTGAAAGWHGLHTDSMGAYLSGLAPFVYDGTDTIDIKIEDASDQSDPAAGAATCYIVYTRVQ